MIPQWLPQNLQKRLLLYVLQQLSLFSEIDLPNLEEVSLNNIHLKDISIDPEKVGKLPGCNLRYGQLASLELNGGVMGGVNIEATGLDVVVAPNLDMEEDITKSVQLQLAQSTADLANTIMEESPDNETVDSESKNGETSGDRKDSKPRSSSNSSNKPSALGGVMQRAVDIALQRLSVKIKDINIKVVAESTDFLIKIDEASLNTVNGTRSINCVGTRIINLKADINPGDGDSEDTESINSDSTLQRDQEDVKLPEGDRNEENEVVHKSSSDEDDDDDDDYDYDNEDSNKTTAEKSLMDSMVFTHEEASSIYMSAASQSFRNSKIDPRPSPVSNKLDSIIVHVDELNIEFEGLSTISNLFVSVNNLAVSCNPLVPTVLGIIDSVSRGLKMKIYQRRKQTSTKSSARNNAEEPEKYDDDYDDETETDSPVAEESQFFNRLHITNIIVSLTSAIRHDGTLAVPKNNLYFNLNNFNIKQKRDTLKYGGIEVFNFIQTKDGEVKKLFEFESPDVEDSAEAPKADIRFELFSKISSDMKVNEFTTLLSKVTHINLDAYSLSNLLELVTSAQIIGANMKSLLANIESYTQLNSGDRTNVESPKKSSAASQIVFQTSNINFNLDLSSTTKVSVQSLPISFNSLSNELKCQKIIIQLLSGDESLKVGSISNVNLSTKSDDFRGHLSHGNTFSRDMLMSSSNTVKVGKVNLEISVDKLMELIRLLGTLSDSVKSNPTRYDLNSILPATSSTLRMASVYNPKKLRKRVTIDNTRSVCDFRIVLEAVNFDLTAITKLFGDVSTRINTLQIFKFNGEYNLMVNDMSVTRNLNDLRERFMYNFNDSGSHKAVRKPPPLIIGSTRGGIFEFKFRNFVFEYFTKWMKLFDDLKKADSKTQMDDSVSTIEPETIKELRKTDIRFQFHDCAIGITPNQLTCKAVIAIDRLTSDLMVGNDQIYGKFTLRDLSLLLIDDVKEIKTVNSNKFSKSLVNWFLNKGFLQIGNVKNLHVGVTYNLDKEKLAQRQTTYNKAAIFDIKINLDEINLETCGDSFHTFTQLINDLKIPVLLSDSEKFKINLDHDINVFEDIEDLEFKSKETAVDPVVDNQDETKSDFEIVDEYYDNSKSSEDLADQVDDLKIAEDENNSLEVHDNYFNKVVAEESSKVNPISVNINLGSFNLYMYDGYDWKQTRQVIKGVVKRVEKESVEDDQEHRTSQTETSNPGDSESAEYDESLDVIEETLFQSIHVTLPKGINPNHLATNINRQVNEENIESNGYKDLKLRRSNKYKMSMEFKNIDINMVILSLRDPREDTVTLQHNQGDYEVLNEIEILVDLVTVYDNLINSTWNKYLTYMNSMGEKEVGKSMFKLNIVTSREPMNLNFNETLMNVSILPVRLFIDQDTNEFLVRFFKFNDSRFHLDKVEEDLYLKKFEVNSSLKIKIDYKPKKLNLIGLKNGEFNQLLNLININGLMINLNSIKLYGIKGIDNLFVRLFEHWLPNIQQTQLINLFSGVELFKPIINISESFRGFMTVPMGDYNDLNNANFYKQLNKSGKEFLKTTSFELLKLGYRLTNGTQNLLEQGEEMLGGTGSKSRKYKPNLKGVQDKSSSRAGSSPNHKSHEDYSYEDPNHMLNNDLLENSIRLNNNVSVESNIYSSNKKYSEVEDEEYETSDEEIEDSKLISLYSNQPKNFKQGVQFSFNSINKNYNLTKDEFLRLIENVNDTNNYEDSLKLLLKRSPLLLLRPMIGTTEILSKTLMGLSNEINSVDRIESRDKYKTED